MRSGGVANVTIPQTFPQGGAQINFALNMKVNVATGVSDPVTVCCNLIDASAVTQGTWSGAPPVVIGAYCPLVAPDGTVTLNESSPGVVGHQLVDQLSVYIGHNVSDLVVVPHPVLTGGTATTSTTTVPATSVGSHFFGTRSVSETSDAISHKVVRTNTGNVAQLTLGLKFSAQQCGSHFPLHSGRDCMVMGYESFSSTNKVEKTVKYD